MCLISVGLYTAILSMIYLQQSISILFISLLMFYFTCIFFYLFYLLDGVYRD